MGTDGDGDLVNGTVDVTLYPNAVANIGPATEGADILLGTNNGETLDGLGANDIIAGNAGADNLIGGLGDDTLTGGSGADTFQWSSTNSGGTDTITDFAQGLGGDVLDISQLLVGDTPETLVSFLSFNFAGGNTTITVDSNGSTGGGTLQTIVLQGVDLSHGGALSDSQIITQLLADVNLKTDV